MEHSSGLIQSTPPMDFWDFHTHQRGSFALCSCDLLREEVPPIADCPYLSVGLHPWFLPKEVSSPPVEVALGQLNKLAREGRIVAVGEAGWDALSSAAPAVAGLKFPDRRVVEAPTQKSCMRWSQGIP